MTPQPIPDLASQVLQVLGVLLLLTGFATVSTRRASDYINAFSLSVK